MTETETPTNPDAPAFDPSDPTEQPGEPHPQEPMPTEPGPAQPTTEPAHEPLPDAPGQPELPEEEQPPPNEYP